MNSRIADALDGLSARELEDLRGAIGKRLATCIVCGADGASPVRFSTPKSSPASKARVSLLICPACFEKHRLPEARSESQSESDSSASHAER